MTVLDVSRVNPEVINGYQVVNANVGDIYTLLATGFASGKFTYEVKPQMQDDGTPGSLVIFRFPDGAPDKFAYPGYWIFSDDSGSVSVFDAPDAQAIRTVNMPLDWTVTPVVDLEANTVAVRQPNSLNGPWTYVVEVDGAAVSATGPEVTKVTDSAGMVVGADAVFTLSAALAVGDHTVVVTCTATKYSLTGTSTSVSVTVPTPAPPPTS